MLRTDPEGSNPGLSNAAAMSDDGRRSPDEDPLTRFLTAESGPLMFVRETLTSAVIVALVGLLLFSASGVWPPMVAVESGSMEPHMQKGDLVFITEPGRFAPTHAQGDTGVVTYRVGEREDYRTFGSYGSVIVYQRPLEDGPPIIHRARFFVEEGENWYSRADKDHVRASNCAELSNCPAPHDGFITKGDDNPLYDQANGIAGPVRPTWIQGIARVRVPLLGWIRLVFSGAAVQNSPGLVVGVEALDTGSVTDSSIQGPSDTREVDLRAPEPNPGTADSPVTCGSHPNGVARVS